MKEMHKRMEWMQERMGLVRERVQLAALGS
jgi:hypothetical protein